MASNVLSASSTLVPPTSGSSVGGDEISSSRPRRTVTAGERSKMPDVFPEVFPAAAEAIVVVLGLELLVYGVPGKGVGGPMYVFVMGTSSNSRSSTNRRRGGSRRVSDLPRGIGILY